MIDFDGGVDGVELFIHSDDLLFPDGQLFHENRKIDSEDVRVLDSDVSRDGGEELLERDVAGLHEGEEGFGELLEAVLRRE